MMKTLVLMAAAAQATLPAPDGIDAAFLPWTGNDRPGCVVGIARDGQPPIVRAYGMADLEQPAPVTADTVFESGSVAKQFTAAVVLGLAEQGKLGLGDDIRRYLPEMPDYGTPITIDHLLTHTSGLRDWSDLADFTGWPRYSKAYSNADALRLLARQRALNHAPGARFSYTNSGYNLLAIIVERVIGQSLAAYARDQLFVPLGMTHSSWRDDFRRLVPGRATGYRERPEGDGLMAGMPMEDAYGSGGMLTTIGDLLIWEQALETGQLGPYVTTKLMEPVTLSDGRSSGYGRGLVLTRFQGVREIFHNGGTNGYQAWAGRYPDQGLVIGLLCNGRTVGPDTQTHKVAALFLPPEPVTPAAPNPPADELAARPGLYVGEDSYAVLEISTRDGQLALKGGGALRYVGEGVYRLGTSELRFIGSGAERRLADGTIITFARKVAAPYGGDLAELVGAYASPETEGRFGLSAAGGALLMRFDNRPGSTQALRPLFPDAYQGDGFLMRVVRNRRGDVAGLEMQTSRVYRLAFRRVLP